MTANLRETMDSLRGRGELETVCGITEILRPCASFGRTHGSESGPGEFSTLCEEFVLRVIRDDDYTRPRRHLEMPSLHEVHEHALPHDDGGARADFDRPLGHATARGWRGSARCSASSRLAP